MRTVKDKKGCKSCDWSHGRRKPAGGIVRLDGQWMLNHYQNDEQGFLGWLALQPELHTEQWDDLEDEELQALGLNIKRIKQALRKYFSEDSVKRIYVIYLFESPFDEPPGQHHLHIHLIPRFAKFDVLLREYGKPTIGGKCTSGINSWNIYRLTQLNAFPEEYRWDKQKDTQKVKALMKELRSLRLP